MTMRLRTVAAVGAMGVLLALPSAPTPATADAPEVGVAWGAAGGAAAWSLSPAPRSGAGMGVGLSVDEDLGGDGDGSGGGGAGAGGSGGAGADPESITWGLSPAPQEGVERANFAYTLDAGDLVRDGIVLKNRSAQPLDLEVYARDALTTIEGNLDLQGADEEPAGLGAWISVETPAVQLAPGESATVNFTVGVPAGTPPGDYGAGIITSMPRGEGDGTVRVDRRLALRVFARVPGELVPAVEVSDVSLTAGAALNPFATSTAGVRLRIANTGNVRIVPRIAADVAGPFGWFGVGAVLEGEEEILPGSVVEREISIPGLRPLGRVTARVEVTAVAVGGGAGQSAQTGASASAWAIPWTAIAALLAIAFLAWRVARAGRGARSEGRGTPPPSPAE